MGIKLSGSRIVKKFKDTGRPGILEWCIIGAILLFCTFFFMYGDITCTIDNSILLAKAIGKGEFFNYYQYSIENASTVWPANYDILIYLIFAVWNLPLAIGNHLFGLDYLNSFPAMMWSKLMLIVFALLAAFVVYKICLCIEMGKEKALWTVFVMMTSMTLIMPTFIITQVDAVNLFFMTAGIYMYVKGDMKKFILFFAISIPLKLFALFVFIPLVLLHEKKIWKIIAYGISGMSIMVVCKLLFWGNDAYNIAVNSFSEKMIEVVQSITWAGGVEPIPVFIALYIAICIWCYIKHADRKDEKDYGIYLPLAVLLVMFLFIPFYPYWIVLVSPFAAIVIMRNDRAIKVNILLDTIGGISMFFVCANVYLWIYSTKIMDTMAAGILFPKSGTANAKYKTIFELMDHFGITQFTPAFMAAFVVCYTAILVINRPGAKLNLKAFGTRIERSVMWSRFIPLVLVVSMYLMCFLIKPDISVYASLGVEGEYCQTNILTPDAVISQGVKFEEDCRLTEIQTKFFNSDASHLNMSSVIVEIKEKNTDQVLFKKRIGSNSFETGEVAKIPVDLKVKKDVDYVVTFTGKDGKNNQLNILLTNELIDQENPAYVNGEPQDVNLYLYIAAEG